MQHLDLPRLLLTETLRERSVQVARRPEAEGESITICSIHVFQFFSPVWQ
ncbi:hypothetical protein H6G80_21250 [Nostoc sp. FACHB-87]|nr:MULTISPECIES: hypothetical protein [Nostocales]MBD2302195.1 hypothetical protein [Nostoc sp. FACHB-190]MBD2456593.1 hypothetical protein [Nostoc sp. FACHB-87]MBD2477940.1 hypothetical protein [Anabaena sp. FACHB-83]MBD2489934.1 hypothetical protein [Aulosira sp. FACHB-615]